MSFNNPQVVEALNALTVPVYLSNDLVVGAERTELTRIHQQGYAKKLSVGSVHAFLVAPDGTLLDSVHVAQGSPERYISMIAFHAKALKLTPGEPLVRPNPPQPPPIPCNGLRLHVVARYLERQPDGTLGLVTNAGGNWSALPGEDWLLFSESEVKSLRAGEPLAVEKLLTHFYPPTENNNLATNRLEVQEWRTAAGAITGSLTLKHPFYSRDDSNRATSRFVGYWRGKTLEVVTTEGRYNGQPFGVAVTTA